MTLKEGCQTIGVTVNGESRSIPYGLTVIQVLEWLGVEPARVAVELNRGIVRQADWATTAVDAGAQIEIVQFVGGG
ncbi:MAG TPA: sulfur carrier protein ThiS [Bryobacteraceae bacterium]|nr:sulfur carrier protein ThiS [Bryobacteraceae bacterium]